MKTIKEIKDKIYSVRGAQVMLDRDLAELYGVETKYLKRQVKRNIIRFPDDFMFQINEKELENLRCQIVTSSSDHGGLRYKPFVFTENGVAMLSSVLRSDQAALVNISIMRIFTKLRSFLLLEKELGDKVNNLERNTNKMFKVVFERLDDLDETRPSLEDKRKRISLK